MKEKQAKMGLNPKDMFKGNKEYSAFNEDGLPTHDAAGTALSKRCFIFFPFLFLFVAAHLPFLSRCCVSRSAMKKLKKDYEKQKKLFEKNKPK